MTYSALSVYGATASGQAMVLPAQPLTVATNPGQTALSSSILASDTDSLRLEAARAPDQQPAPPGVTPVPTIAAAPSATPTPAGPSCDLSGNGLYCVYTVQSGDTLSKIAKQFGLKGTAGVASWELLVQSNKPDITSADDVIQTGQKLRIPVNNGIVHLVLTGETLGELAADYGVTSASITAANGNVPSTGALNIGQEVLIPDPAHLPPIHPAPATPPAIAAPAGTGTPEATATADTGNSTPAATGTATAAAAASPAASGTPRTAGGTVTKTPATGGTSTAPSRSRAGFIWPVTGPISSYFGPSHPLGIDIDLYANPNAPIAAAAAGKVTFAGGDSCCSYGLYVIVDHGNGYSTLYAHLSRINVAVGQQVTQGQTVGLGGRTGYATGNHLHFEVRLNGNVIDPLSVLP